MELGLYTYSIKGRVISIWVKQSKFKKNNKKIQTHGNQREQTSKYNVYVLIKIIGFEFIFVEAKEVKKL